jgi:hypothetical protein
LRRWAIWTIPLLLHMTRVALLHDGRLLREWRGTEWQSLQHGDGGVTLEQAMVGCLCTASA